MNLTRLAEAVHQKAVDNGWYDGEKRELPELIALCHSELSEALEEYRAGKKVNEVYYSAKTKVESITDGLTIETKIMSTQKLDGECGILLDPEQGITNVAKPEGIAVELVDTLIRLLDMFGYYGVDVQAIFDEKLGFNAERGYRHGNKKI